VGLHGVPSFEAPRAVARRNPCELMKMGCLGGGGGKNPCRAGRSNHASEKEKRTVMTGVAGGAAGETMTRGKEADPKKKKKAAHPKRTLWGHGVHLE